MTRNEPTWASTLPPHIRLTSDQVERLEIIRSAIGESHTDFALHIRSQPESVRMLQVWLFEKIKRENPRLTDDMAIVRLIVSRFLSAQITGDDLFGLADRLVPYKTPDADSVAAVQEVMRQRGLRSLDDVVDAILEEESTLPMNPPVPGYEEVARQVTLILAEPRHRVQNPDR